MISDAQLVQAAVEGDRQAFGRIVERYQNLVCAVAYSRLGDLAGSEDLAQETFVAAWKQLGELRDPARLRSWLCGIVRNLTRNQQRRQARHPDAVADDQHASLERADSQPTPIQRAIKQEEAQLLWDVLRDIPENYREPLILFYREDHSIAAVAQQLDLSEDAVKQRLSRGRQMLKTQVAAFVEETLSHTQPGKAFASLVMGALPAAAPQALSAAAASVKGAGAMKAAAATGMAGAILGPLIGLFGAFLGAKASLDATRSPRERSFVWKMIGIVSLLVTTLLTVQMVAIFFFADLYATVVFQVALWGTYSVLLIAIIHWGNRRQRAIQVADGTAQPHESAFVHSLETPPKAVVWSLAGAMLGGVCWVLPLAMLANDWVTAAIVMFVTFAAWCTLRGWINRGLDAKKRVRAYQYAVAVIGAVGGITAVSRWSAWQASSETHLSHLTPLWAIVASLLLLCTLLAAGIEIQYRRYLRAAERRN